MNAPEPIDRAEGEEHGAPVRNTEHQQGAVESSAELGKPDMPAVAQVSATAIPTVAAVVCGHL